SLCTLSLHDALPILHNDPELAHYILKKITVVTIDYLNMQIDAGVNALQLFDSWAQALSWDDYKEFSHQYNNEIISKLNRKGVPRSEEHTSELQSREK